MNDIHDEKEAQTVIESACPNSPVRRVALSIFGEAIREVNIYGRDKWALRVEKTLRLTVKHYYVCTLCECGVWLALDDRFNFPQNNLAPMNNYYPTFQQCMGMGARSSRATRCLSNLPNDYTRTKFLHQRLLHD